MDLLCVRLHLFECFRSPLGVSGVELLAGQIRHLADKFGIQKALVSGLGFIRFDLKRGKSSWTVIQARGESGDASQRQGGYDYGGRNLA
jgi:hypothetical protein